LQKTTEINGTELKLHCTNCRK